MIIFLLLAATLRGPGALARQDSAARFLTRVQPGRPANCHGALVRRRVDRLEELGLEHPEFFDRFRRALSWEMIEDRDVRTLRGIPRPPAEYTGPQRPQDDPAFFVIVPMKPLPGQAIMTINVRPRKDEVRMLLRTEAERSPAIFHVVANSFDHVEHGVCFERASLDVAFFNASDLGHGMALASKLAAGLFSSASNIQVKLVQQHGGLAQRFVDAFAWSDVKENGFAVKIIGTPTEKALAGRVRVEVERAGRGSFLDLHVVVNLQTPVEYQAVVGAFDAVQTIRPFRNELLKAEAPRLRIVGAPTAVGTLLAHFPGDYQEGRAGLRDGLNLALTTLDVLR